ncbi:hypothetical protein N0V93_004216 [Gnomoniopsis smithogilvyi]|uniref:Uncharacterized protein n=1 Tax=Gnomoniopsis smithogilvyi TaxID=1191159 RepID=A0A9W9CWW0_9PEZI|nr:hypothetical protein N0V93_004216 [Gnomoniopsis smithogilvyi]
MSFTGGNQTEADHIPGAFPSEAEVIGAEQNTHTSQNSTLSGSKATTGGNVDEKQREFLEQQEAAHTAGGWQTDKHTPGFKQNENRSGTISSQDKTLSQESSRAGLETPTSGARIAETSSSVGEPNLNTHNTGHDESSMGSSLATMATAVGLAAKDAIIAAKDSAAPAASAATEQAKNLTGYGQENTTPSVNHAAEQDGNSAAYNRNNVASSASSGNRDIVPTDGALSTAGSAATYAKDTAYSAANTAQSYAPSILGEPSNTGSVANTNDNASRLPASQGDKPLGTTHDLAVENKSQTDKNLLGQSQTQETKRPHADLTNRVQGLEEQLSPESMTPGVVTVLGTEQDRSFPLGATDHVVPT